MKERCEVRRLNRGIRVAGGGARPDGSRWRWPEWLRQCLLVLLSFSAAGQSPFTWNDLPDGRLELREAGNPVLIYNYAPQLAKGAPENRRRCCYIFPLYTPAGVSMLDDFPADHPHHRGLFWAWPVVETGGTVYDEWMNMTARERTEGKPQVSASNQPTLEAVNIWEAGGRDIVRERLRIVAFPTRGNSREGASRSLEVTVTLAALNAPVTLRGSREQGKSYGGFSARFAPREDTVLRADGETLAKDEDLTPRHWAELEATYGGKRVALRITPDPQDPGAPYQWCLRKYGFVGASFPGRTATSDGFTLEPLKPITLKYRITVKDIR